MLNENIKYCRKPLESLFSGPLKKEEKKIMTCISGISKGCVKKFKTTKEHRICKYCMEDVICRNQGAIR